MPIGTTFFPDVAAVTAAPQAREGSTGARANPKSTWNDTWDRSASETTRDDSGLTAAGWLWCSLNPWRISDSGERARESGQTVYRIQARRKFALIEMFLRWRAVGHLQASIHRHAFSCSVTRPRHVQTSVVKKSAPATGPTRGVARHTGRRRSDPIRRLSASGNPTQLAAAPCRGYTRSTLSDRTQKRRARRRSAGHRVPSDHRCTR